VLAILIENNIAHLKMNLPEKRNSMILDFWAEVLGIIADIDAGNQARVILLSSTGAHSLQDWINPFLHLSV
jgi:enoyl-CoA hydratase